MSFFISFKKNKDALFKKFKALVYWMKQDWRKL